MNAFMRQDILGAIFASCVSGLTVIATYRAEKNEGKTRIFAVMLISMFFTFMLSILILYFVLQCTGKPELNIIRTEPDF